MLFRMITRKHAPEHLLGVVVHVIVAVPGGTDFAARPITKQARCNLAFTEAACKPVLVVIPPSLEFLIFELHRRTGPKIIPILV